MNFLKHSNRFRLISISAILLLCVSLASIMTQQGSSNGLLKTPSVELQASKSLITYPCPPDGISISRSCPTSLDMNVALTSIARNFNKQTLYVYTVSGGRVIGEGSKVAWDLSGVWPGVYTATVEVRDSKKHRALSSVSVQVVNCSDCVISEPCPTIAATCYDEVKAGTLITCKVVVGPRPRPNLITFEWSAHGSSREDVSGRISSRGPTMSIPTNGLGGQTVYIRVEVKGLDPSCSSNASSSTTVKP